MRKSTTDRMNDYDAVVIPAAESRFLWRGSPPSGSRFSMPYFNEPYTTVRLALAAIAASSSSERSAALRTGPTSSTSMRFGMTLATILR